VCTAQQLISSSYLRQQQKCGAPGGSPMECEVVGQHYETPYFQPQHRHPPSCNGLTKNSMGSTWPPPHRGVGRFCSCLHKCGMTPSAACECGAEEQTVDHVVLRCTIHRPPYGTHGLTFLDDETRGVTRGARGHNSPGAESVWGRRITAGGAKWLREAPKSPNNIVGIFFNTVHLLPKYLRYEHRGAKAALCPGRHQTSLRPWTRQSNSCSTLAPRCKICSYDEEATETKWRLLMRLTKLAVLIAARQEQRQMQDVIGSPSLWLIRFIIVGSVVFENDFWEL